MSKDSIPQEAAECNVTRTYLLGGELWDITVSQHADGYYARCPQWATQQDRVGLTMIGCHPTIEDAFDRAQYWTCMRLQHGPQYMGEGR